MSKPTLRSAKPMIIAELMKVVRAIRKDRNSGPFLARRHGVIAKNVAVLSFGTALSQLLNIISTPVLSWYYTPESFGIMATSLAIVYIASSLANANYEAAIVMTKTKNKAEDLLSLCLILNIFSSILFFIITYFAVRHIDSLSDYSSWYFLMILSIGVAFTSTFNSLQYYAVRTEDYSAASASHVFRTLFGLVIQMSGALFNGAALWLIAGRVFAPLPSIGYALSRDWRSLQEHQLKLRFADLVNIARSYRRFPLFAAPQRAIALLAEEMPTLVLASVFGPGPAGYYWFSNRLLQMPCGVISQAIGRVFSREAAKNVHQNRTTFRPAIRIVAALALVSMPVVAIIIIWAPDVFNFILGPQWQTAAIYCQWIAIWVFFRFSLSPVLCLFTVLSEQKRLLKLDSVTFVIRAGLIAYCAFKLDALALVMSLSIFESLKIAIYGLIILRLARKPPRSAQEATPDIQVSAPLPYRRLERSSNS